MAALVLYFIPNIMLASGIDPAYSQIITGALTIFVVLVGGLLRKRTGKT
jgi:ribose/xylose/arabinose/galactoside ABC-type transport system permease subunit